MALTTFSDLGLDTWLVDTLSTMAIDCPTEIQEHCIPAILQGRNVLGGAKTGSGKTAAFALPILQTLSEDPYGVYALVITPTRELALQITQQFEVLGTGIDLDVMTVVGGLELMQQVKELARRPHIVVATPGRLLDVIRTNPEVIHFKRLRYLVLDEVDELLSNAFVDSVHEVFQALPKKRQTLVFSATMPQWIIDRFSLPSAATSHSNEDDRSDAPFVHVCQSEQTTVSTLSQQFILTPSRARHAYLYHLLTQDTLRGMLTIIFVPTCRDCEQLRLMLRELEIRCTAIHSKMRQKDRVSSINRFKSSTVKVLLATDVASRGLDIPSVQLVINYNVPLYPAVYIHRVGRTARAGRYGMAISMVTEDDAPSVLRIEERIGRQLDQYPVEEKKVMDKFRQVNRAKGNSAVQMYTAKFGERDLIYKLKERRQGRAARSVRALSAKPSAL
ncbi:putative RNA helicase [Dimargaris verticillata]|uniref:RNA helicase n=1 Tax=Dimargaris verticillata TaxID=2761393 RepID=A0A9W8B6D5_9FUNG|nr:putative RNA helicase [Dimargaris verticillata]